ncbi:MULTISPECIES: S-adenosyl-l-methionine hydroxide adenosyltransferase family protein [Anaeromyxobacter]|uniref:SAM hydrolase/SAM-dependent halogenase family protein n=1 Tax=Anaeromyxobacter TaxID=161492 RepID=UPI001F5823D4|nr:MULTISPECIES: SAM-dependent chlorinase/fluorinase [unclassified Anaeromyxobacter]
MGPLFTLLTDFGAGSGYPAQLKAVLLAAHPDARLVDVSHEVPAFDVLAGALLLEACVPWFPPAAIHLAVVDPGVGTARRALCVVDPAGRLLVGPDNGLLTPFLGAGARAFEITPGVAVPAPRSATFHGRDLFAPAAAFLAAGGAPERLGPSLSDPERLAWPGAERRGGALAGVTLAADPFGNLVTSVREADLAGAAVAEVRVGGERVRFVRTFGDGAPGELVAYVGSGGRVELAVREGSAAARLGARGVGVELVLA